MNKQLKNAPLVEVVFELRFQQKWEDYDYSIELSELNSALKEKFPIIRSLPSAQLPPRFPEYTTRHRLFSSDEKRLISLGEFLFSFNTLDYKNSESFVEELKDVLGKYASVVGQRNLVRKGLRYINKISLKDKSVNDVLETKIGFPPYLEKNTIGHNLLYVSTFDEGVENTRIVKNQNEDFMFLDFDFFNESLVEIDSDELFDWFAKAHDHISKTFSTTLSKKYFESL